MEILNISFLKHTRNSYGIHHRIQAPCFASHQLQVFREEIQSGLYRRPQSPLPQHPSKLPSNPAEHSTFPHFLHLIHQTLTSICYISVFICGDRPLTERYKNPLTSTNSFANSQHRVSAPRNDVDTEPLVRTASVSWFLCFIFHPPTANFLR